MRATTVAALSALALATPVIGVQVAGTRTATAQSGNAPPDVTQIDMSRIQGVQARDLSRSWTPLNSASGGLSSVDKLMGRTVVGSDGKTIGTVTDVILGPDGQAQQLVVHNGGFLGMGGRELALDVGRAETRLGEDTIRLRDVTRADALKMPAFRYEDGMASLNRSPPSHDKARD
jgi:sporulation protein YlmC with PRC-barrel domain